MKLAKNIAALVLVATMLSGCAAFHKQNPQLPPEVVVELNLASELRQLQGDYIRFFTDVGSAKRSGQLTQIDVDRLNVIGDKLEKVIERGNGAFKSWEANKADNSLRAAVVAAISEGSGLLFDLTSQQRSMVRVHEGGAH